jgi:hypothetical protein
MVMTASERQRLRRARKASGEVVLRELVLSASHCEWLVESGYVGFGNSESQEFLKDALLWWLTEQSEKDAGLSENVTRDGLKNQMP